MSNERGNVTQVLRAYAEGTDGAFDDLFALVYDQLRHIARKQLGWNHGETMNTTGLVHEAYLKMVDQTSAQWNDRSHFYAISARAMRQILVDYARRRKAGKRGAGALHEPLDENQSEGMAQEVSSVLQLDEALQGLSRIDERMVRVVECRFFAGMTEDEVAEALGMSVRTVQRTWKRARAWLKVELGE